MSKERGVLLLEINFVLLLVFILFTTFYEPLFQFILGLKHMKEDMALCMQERLLLARLEQELIYETRELILEQQNEERTLLTCRFLNSNKTRQFFCRPHKSGSGYTLYQSTQVIGRQKSINPLTPPHVKVTTFLFQPLNEHSLKVTLGLSLVSASRQRNTTRYMKLGNGTISVHR